MKKKVKKQAWWLKFADGSIKKVFTESMTAAWKRGVEMGSPVSISGCKQLAESHLTEAYSKEKELVKAASPEELIGILEYLIDPYATDPHAGDDPGALIVKMRQAAQRALVIVDNFPKVIIES